MTRIEIDCVCGWQYRYQGAPMTLDQLREVVGPHQCNRSVMPDN